MSSRIRQTLPIAAAVAALASLAAPPAMADELRPVVRDLPETRGEVLNYWTPQRHNSARPARMPSTQGTPAVGRSSEAPDGTGKPQPSGRKAPALPKRKRVKGRKAPKRPARQAAASWSGLELPWTNSSYGYTSSNKATGRLFYTMPNGERNFCSASVVATNVVVTAGHCVVNSNRENSRFEFVPNMYGNSRPYGAFVGRAISYYSEWSNSGHFALDYAFVTLHRNTAGYDVGAYTGAYGLWTNAPKSDVYVLGYPGEGSWSTYANYPWHCKSPIQRYSRYADGRYDVGLSCYNTGGSSGGPWFQTASDGRAYISSVMSHMGVVRWQRSDCTWTGCPRYGLTFFGAYFDGSTTRLFNMAKVK